MPAYVTREEFEARVGVLEREVEGERAVTRHILEQTHRNGDDLGTIKSRFDRVEARLDHMAGDIVVIKADLGRHGRMLDVLTQDMRLVRGAIDTLIGSLPGMVVEAVRTLNREPPTSQA
jgi:hypothetical protein